MSFIEKAIEKRTSVAQAEMESKASEAAPADSSESASTIDTASAQPAQIENPIQDESQAPLFDLSFERLSARGFLSPDLDKHQRLQEEYRVIKRKLLHNAFAGKGQLVPKGNMIMVTSCHPREGKTFNAINLALSIALERDKTVLLIDGDVLKPSLDFELDLPEETHGLMDYLNGSVNDIGEVIYHTTLPNFRIIPAGTPQALSNELLASERMFQVMEELMHRYSDRIIILDSPPVLGVSDTQVLTHYAGQVVFVVQEQKTVFRDVKQALSQFPEGIAVGYVMNRSSSSKSGKYGYYYGYGYGYGYGSKEKGSRRSKRA